MVRRLVARPGTNSELHLVDERIVGSMPKRLDLAEAAALPLTSITAWELLFDRLAVARDGAARGESLLVVGRGAAPARSSCSWRASSRA